MIAPSQLPSCCCYMLTLLIPCMHALKHHTTAATVDSQMASLETSMARLLELLGEASSFVDAVVAGDAPADPEVGRRIADTLAVVPRMRPEVFAKMFDSNLQDLLMVSYLSSLTRTQLAIAEKLTV
jgi:translation initiation factor 3 subunit F